MEPLKNCFKFGEHEEYNLRYLGWQIDQTQGKIEVNQDHYVYNLEEVDMSFVANKVQGRGRHG